MSSVSGGNVGTNSLQSDILILKVVNKKNPMKRFYSYLGGAAGVIGGLVLSASAHATSFFSVPTSTAPTLTANIGDQLGDAGTLAVVALAAGIPLAFWVIHALIGLLPRSRGRR